MHTLVLTVIGEDRPGIVEQLSTVVLQHKGNWLKSSFSYVSGRFAGVLEIALPDNEQESLERTLGELTNLNIVITSGTGVAVRDFQSVHLWLTGNDKQGIVQEVSQALSKMDVNVLQLDTDCDVAANSSQPIFRAEVELEVPVDVDVDDVKDALESIANDLIVDIELSQRL